MVTVFKAMYVRSPSTHKTVVSTSQRTGICVYLHKVCWLKLNTLHMSHFFCVPCLVLNCSLQGSHFLLYLMGDKGWLPRTSISAMHGHTHMSPPNSLSVCVHVRVYTCVCCVCVCVCACACACAWLYTPVSTTITTHSQPPSPLSLSHSTLTVELGLPIALQKVRHSGL